MIGFATMNLLQFTILVVVFFAVSFSLGMLWEKLMSKERTDKDRLIEWFSFKDDNIVSDEEQDNIVSFMKDTGLTLNEVKTVLSFASSFKSLEK